MASQKQALGFNPWKIYDVSADEIRKCKERAKLRESLSKEYMKKVSNPFRGVNGHVIDPAVQRWMSMRTEAQTYMKPTAKSAKPVLLYIIAPIALIMYLSNRSRKEYDHRSRTGQIAYKDKSYNW